MKREIFCPKFSIHYWQVELRYTTYTNNILTMRDSCFLKLKTNRNLMENIQAYGLHRSILQKFPVYLSWKKTNGHWSIKHYTEEKKRLININLTKTGMNPGALEGLSIPALPVAPKVLPIRWLVIIDERMTGLWQR